MSVDAFLFRYFREAEKAREPRCVSAEAATRGSFAGAAHAEEWRTWSIVVVGRAERAGLTDQHKAVMAAVYLQLGVEHVEVLRHQGRTSVRPLAPREKAAREADVFTWASWSAICRTLWGRRTGALERDARRLWRAGRLLVAAALADEPEGGLEAAS